MTKDRELLKADIEKIDDEEMLEKIRIFILGITEQQPEKTKGLGPDSLSGMRNDKGMPEAGVS